MAIPLDYITRKKLILVRQLFQRAVLQAEANHSYVDRIMALITFDLANETALKAVVSAVNTAVLPKTEFQPLVQQTDNELSAAGLASIPDKAKIQHVRTIRNDAQHKAKYPNETDVSDCRTYTRDFLQQIIFNVWNADFNSISLLDAIQNTKIKAYLIEAENELKNNNDIKAIVNSKVALQQVFSSIENSIVGGVPSAAVSPARLGNRSSSIGQYSASSLHYAFMHLRDLLLIRTIGLELQSYVKYKSLTEKIGIHYSMDGNISWNKVEDYVFQREETEFVINFVTNSILQIENLVGDIDKPFNI